LSKIIKVRSALAEAVGLSVGIAAILHSDSYGASSCYNYALCKHSFDDAAARKQSKDRGF